MTFRVQLLLILCLFLTTKAQAEELDALLPEEEGETLSPETIVITGSRTEHKLEDALIATEVITRREIETSGADNTSDLLKDQTGIDLSRSFRGAGVRIQGMDSKHVLILIDGERVAGRIEGAIDLSRIPIESIERVEIVKGPSSALYGSDAMAGVVNIITRNSREEIEGEAKVAYGSLNSVDLNTYMGLRNRTWSTTFSGGFHRIDPYDLRPDDLATTGSGHSQWNVANRTQYRFNEKTKINGRAEYFRRDQQGVDINSAGAVFDRRNLTETLSLTIAPTLKFANASKLRLSTHFNMFRDQFLLDQRQSGAMDKDEETIEKLGQVTLQYDSLLFESHLVTIGSEGLYQSLESVRLKKGEGERFRGAIFIQDEWTVARDPNVVLAPGARVDVDSQFGVHATPKVAMRFDPLDSMVVRASYGMGFRAPVFKELLLIFENPSRGYIVEGNPDLVPERSQSVNLGTEFKPTKAALLSINAFHNDIDDLIFIEAVGEPVVGQTQKYIYTNIASAFTRGIETQAQYSYKSILTLKAGYVFTDTRDNKRKRKLEGRALHRGTFDLRFHQQTFGIETTFRASIVGERPFYTDSADDESYETEFSDSYATADFRLAKQIGQTLKIFAGIENILNTGESEFLPIQPRTFYGGISGQI